MFSIALPKYNVMLEGGKAFDISLFNGHNWTRTSDPYDVNVVL